MANMQLDRKAIVVTGSTKGIGRGIALTAAGEGASVVVSGRDEEAGVRVVREIEELGQAAAMFVRADIANVDQCRDLIDRTRERFGRIDGLVNNAGIFPYASLLDTDEQTFDDVLAVNLRGAFFCCRYAIEAMAEAGGGSIVNIGSTHGFDGGLSLAAYACSKGALYTLTRHVAKNYTRQRIRCNWITVGWVDTPGERDAVERRGRNLDWLRERSGAMPLGRLQTDEDIARGAVYLLSDAAEQVTGSDLKITGGFAP